MDIVDINQALDAFANQPQPMSHTMLQFSNPSAVGNPTPATPPASLEMRMAAAMTAIKRDGRDPTEEDLRRAGFTANEIARTYKAAWRRAEAGLTRHIEHFDLDPAPAPGEARRTHAMAEVLAQLLPSRFEQITALQGKGFRTDEIERLLPQALPLACDLSQHGGL